MEAMRTQARSADHCTKVSVSGIGSNFRWRRQLYAQVEFQTGSTQRHAADEILVRIQASVALNVYFWLSARYAFSALRTSRPPRMLIASTRATFPCARTLSRPMIAGTFRAVHRHGPF